MTYMFRAPKCNIMKKTKSSFFKKIEAKLKIISHFELKFVT